MTTMLALFRRPEGGMRAAGRNLRDITPGLTTLLVLEDVPEMDVVASPGVDTVETTVEERP